MPFQLGILLQRYMWALPSLLFALIACAVILAQWRKAPRAFFWALLGFGLQLFLSVINPLVYLAIEDWVKDGSGRHWAFNVTGVIFGLLYVVAQVLLLVAILAGRSKPPVVNQDG